LGPGVSGLLKQPSILNPKPPETPKIQEMIKEINVMCYVYKDKNGHWQISGELPTDVTPFYQRWWQTLKRKWRA
jgi:hypothetical protein